MITGYGTSGPDADRAAYDIAAFWARSGIAHLLAPPGGPLPFQRGGMGDHSTGVAFAGAISAALFARERTGEGQVVTTSLLRQGVYTIGFDLNITLGWGLSTQVGQRETMGNPAINNYTAGDGHRFWIVGLEGARHWPPLCRVVGHPEWIDDERFATPAGRFQNARELIALIDAEFATKSLDEWAEIFATEPDFFWAPVNGPEEVVNDPQLRHAGGLVERARRVRRHDDDRLAGRLRGHAVGAALDRPAARRAHPRGAARAGQERRGHRGAREGGCGRGGGGR